MPVFLFTQIFTVVGILLFFIAVMIYRHSGRTLARRSVHVQGQVVDNIRSVSYHGVGADSRRQIAYFPVVQFITENGVEIEAKSSYGTGRIKYPEWTVVDIWYDPENPESFHMNNYMQFIHGPILILSGMGVVFTFFGLVFGYLALTGELG